MKNLSILILTLFSFTAALTQERVADEKEGPYCSGLFCHQGGTWFNMESGINENTASAYFNILDWLQGRIAGLQVYTLRNGTRLALIRNMPATIYVDEIRMDPSYLNVLPVFDIAAVNVIKQPFGLGAPGGVIAIYTKRGDEIDEDS
jgi:hypothetical protein